MEITLKVTKVGKRYAAFAERHAALLAIQAIFTYIENIARVKGDSTLYSFAFLSGPCDEKHPQLLHYCPY